MQPTHILKQIFLWAEKQLKREARLIWEKFMQRKNISDINMRGISHGNDVCSWGTLRKMWTISVYRTLLSGLDLWLNSLLLDDLLPSVCSVFRSRLWQSNEYATSCYNMVAPDRLFIWLPERLLLKMLHTDGNEMSSRREFGHRPQSSGPDTSCESISQFNFSVTITEQSWRNTNWSGKSSK